MDPYKYSAVSHQDLVYCNPISYAKMEEVLHILELDAGSKVLDIGCGKAELLIRSIELFDVEATGVDRSPYFMQTAREQAAKRVKDSSKLQLLEIDIADFNLTTQSYDLAVCMGATEVFGGYEGTLERLSSWVKPGGQIIVGEGYWKKEPPEAYLKALEGTREEFKTHAENVAAGVARGLIPFYALVCSDDDWDRYEWLHCRAVERFAGQNPEDPDVPALLQRIRSWRDLYLQYGRDTLGFGLYLFQK